MSHWCFRNRKPSQTSQPVFLPLAVQGVDHLVPMRRHLPKASRLAPTQHHRLMVVHLVPMEWADHLVPMEWAVHLVPMEWAVHLAPMERAFHLAPMEGAVHLVPMEWAVHLAPMEHLGPLAARRGQTEVGC